MKQDNNPWPLSKREHYIIEIVKGMLANPENCRLSQEEMIRYANDMADLLVTFENRGLK